MQESSLVGGLKIGTDGEWNLPTELLDTVRATASDFRRQGD